MSFLADMADGSRLRVETARRRTPEAELHARIGSLPPAPRLARHAQRFDLIAEVKLRSPAAGVLADGGSDDPAQRVSTYARAGAAAVSVLTEPSRFDGSMDHLVLAAKALAGSGVPAMRKDFLVDPYQVLEARAAGAGGVLVILRMLPRGLVDELLDCASASGLFVLLEAFDEHDLEVAADIVSRESARGHLLVGVNCRDLASLQVVPGRLVQLAKHLPANVPRVAESGVATADDARRVAAAGYDFALVGSALMTAADPAALVTDLLASGRGARADS
jgi:indole-3-glycerol phosphate synthase